MITYSFDSSVKPSSSLLYALLLQQDTFDCSSFSCLDSLFHPIHIKVSKLQSNNILCLENPSNVLIDPLFNPKYLVNYTFFLQIWAILNDGVIIHGALLNHDDFYVGITGPGGTGKTYAAITHCLQNSEVFCGDDIFFLHKNIAYPIIRPLCIYPDHITSIFNPNMIPHDISLYNKYFLKFYRKFLFELAPYSTFFSSAYLESLNTMCSDSTWAYVDPTNLGLTISSEPKLLKNFQIPSFAPLDDPNQILQGTIQEFNYCSYLDVIVLRLFFRELSSSQNASFIGL